MDVSPSSILLETFIIMVLVLLNAFFSASEMAIISLSRSKINNLASEGNKKASLLLKLLGEPSKFLSTIQVGITFSGFLASAFAASSVSNVLGAVLSKFNVPAGNELALVLITIVLSFISLVLGELFPKRVALQNAEAIAMFSVKPLLLVSKISSPFVTLLTVFTNILVKIFGLNTNKLEEHVSEEEIRMMIDVGEENGVINETEKEMIDGIFEFDDTLAKEIMTPRTNVFCIDINTPANELIDSILEEQYSRIPVYDTDIDNIIGVLYMKDLFICIRNNIISNIEIRNILRPAFFVPETKNIDTLFKELKSSKNHMVFLIDEYGGFSGVVTIEDVIEEVMGNIFDEYDEYDEGDDDIKKIDKDTYLVNGLTSISDLNEALDLKLPSENFDTIGGFVIQILESIPDINDHQTIEYENLKFTIENVEEKRIDKIKIHITHEGDQSEKEE